jgi:hypothetical protein
MKKGVSIKSSGIIFIISFFLFAACHKVAHQGNGYLEGTISIGPICPVEHIPPDPACQPTAETYRAYPVSVFTEDGKRKITQLNPSLNGSFSTDLQPGNYMVILETAQNKTGGSNLPAVVTITSNDKTLLNIDIDTGIR